MRKTKQPGSIIRIVLVIGLLVILFDLGYALYKKSAAEAWKNFSNTKYNYTLEYPTHWLVATESGEELEPSQSAQVFFYSPDNPLILTNHSLTGPFVAIRIFPNPQHYGPLDWYNNQSGQYYIGYPLLHAPDEQDITIQGREALKIAISPNTENSEYYYFIDYGDSIMNVTLERKGQIGDPDTENNFLNMLQSLKLPN